MKSGSCPKCKSRDLIVIEEATVPDESSANAVYKAALAAHYGKTGEVGLFGDKMRRTSVGFSVYVCGGCSFSEIYARDLETLRAMASARVASVRPI